MREIKFRGRAISTGEWVYSTEPDHKDLVWAMRDFWDNVYHRGIDPATVGQWTGLSDTNGVDVYEGDILYAPLNKTKYEVMFGCYDNEQDDSEKPEQINGFYLRSISDGFCESSAGVNNHGIEVIGNIHEKGESK